MLKQLLGWNFSFYFVYSNNVPDYSTLTAPPPPPPPVPEAKKKTSDEPKAPPLSGAGAVPHSFKDLVAMKAAEENLEFFPLAGKTHEARQVIFLRIKWSAQQLSLSLWCPMLAFNVKLQP